MALWIRCKYQHIEKESLSLFYFSQETFKVVVVVDVVVDEVIKPLL